jgi:hypothetical protein
MLIHNQKKKRFGWTTQPVNKTINLRRKEWTDMWSVKVSSKV